MKQIKTLLIATFLFIGASQSISAQSKIAHVDTNELISKMPAMIEAQKQLETLSKQYDAEFKTMADEYYAKLKKYDEEAATVTEKINEERAKEVQDMEKRIRDYRETAQKELQQKESDLAKPLMEKIKADYFFCDSVDNPMSLQNNEALSWQVAYPGTKARSSARK